MPTIHIHDDDSNYIAALVAHILAGEQLPLMIRIDNVDSPRPSGGPTQPWYKEAKAFDDLIAKAEAATAAARAATEHHPLVDAVIEAERTSAKAVTVGERERQRLIDTRIVGCPKCKARPGQTCQSPSGDSYGNTFVHSARHTAYNQSRRVKSDEA